MRGIRLMAIAGTATLVTLIGGALPAYAAPTKPPSAPSWISYNSKGDDPIGLGLNPTYTADGVQTVMQKSGGRKKPVKIWFTLRDANGYVGTWTLDLAAPDGNVLKTGHYANVEHFPNQTKGHPGLSFSGMGRSCTQVSGSFDIIKISFDRTGVAVLDATFRQYCDGAKAPLEGIIHIS